MAESDVEVRFGANTEALKEGIEGAKEQLDSIKEHVEGLGETFKTLGEIAGVALSIDAFKEWIDRSAELGENMTRLSAQLGASVPQVSELSAVSKLTGTSFEGLVHSVERMQLRLTQAGRDTSAVGQALRVLGINAKEFAASSVHEQLDKMAEAFSRFGDGPGKLAASIALLGRSGADMIPFLDRGKEGLDELREVSARTGAVMSTEMAQAFGRTKEDISELSLAWQGLSNRIFQVVNPAIDAAIKGLTKLIESMDVGAVRSGVSALTGVAIDLVTSIRVFSAEAAAALDALMVKIGQAVSLFEKLYNVETVSLKVAINPGGAAADVAIKGFERLRDLSKDISDALTGAGAGGTKAFGDLGAGITPLETKINDLRGAAMMLKKDMNDAMGGAGLPGGRAGHEETSGLGAGKPQVPPIDTTGARSAALAEAAKNAETEANKEIKLAQDAAKGVEDTLNEQLKTHQITTAQWLAGTEAALITERDATIAAYQQEEHAAGVKASQINALKAKEVETNAAFNLKIREAELKAAEESAASWQKAMSTINGAFTSQISGLLKGTTNWATAFKNVLSSLTEDLLKFFVDWGLKQAETVAMNIAGIGAIPAAQTAATATQTAAIAAGAVAQKALNATTITGDAAKAAAGAYSAVAGIPVIGPILAPIAAGVAFSAVEAFGSFDQGSWQLPGDMMAQVHAGEMIVPAAQTPWVQSLLTNGGGGQGGAGATHNWNIAVNGSGLSKQEIVNAIRQNVDAITRSLNAHQSLNPSSQPAW